MHAVIAVFNSLSVRGRSRYTADFDNQIYVPQPKVHSDFPKALYHSLVLGCESSLHITMLQFLNILSHSIQLIFVHIHITKHYLTPQTPYHTHNRITRDSLSVRSDVRSEDALRFITNITGTWVLPCL